MAVTIEELKARQAAVEAQYGVPPALAAAAQRRAMLPKNPVQETEPAAALPPPVNNDKIDLSAQPDDFSLQPAQTSALGEWWRGSDLRNNFNKYGKPTQGSNHSDAAVGDPGGTAPKAAAPKQKTTDTGIASAIPVPQSANPYSLNAAALPEVPAYDETPNSDALNAADRVGEFLAKQRTNEPTKESMQALIAPNSFGMYPKGAGPTPEDNFTKHATISMLGSPSEQQQQQVGDLVKQGYKEVNNLQSAPGDYEGTPFYRKTTDITAEQLQKSDPARYRALMELQALREADAAGQAKQYQQTGLTPPPIVRKGNLNEPITTIMQPNAPVTGKSLDPNAPKPFDMNNMEEYKVEIPGKGWMTGIRQKDPNRQQGTLSVAPGLSDGERQQVAQIESNQARQAAYGVSRKTGELYDAAQQHQQQQAALAALKQLQMQQEQAYQNKQLSLDERKALAAENQNAMTNEYNAGRLMVDRARLLQPNIKAPPIPTTSGIVDSVYKRTGGVLPKDMTRQKLIDEELRGSYGLGLDDEQSKPEFFQSTDPRFSGMVMHRRADGSITPISPDVYLLDLYQKQYGHLRGGDTPQPVGQ